MSQVIGLIRVRQRRLEVIERATAVLDAMEAATQPGNASERHHLEARELLETRWDFTLRANMHNDVLSGTDTDLCDLIFLVPLNALPIWYEKSGGAALLCHALDTVLGTWQITVVDYRVAPGGEGSPDAW